MATHLDTDRDSRPAERRLGQERVNDQLTAIESEHTSVRESKVARIIGRVTTSLITIITQLGSINAESLAYYDNGGEQYQAISWWLALQITTEAQEARMVVEDSEGAATRRAEVNVYGFDDLRLLIDSETVAVSDRAELVTAAAQDASSIHRGGLATVEIAGNGYQVQLPGCRDAGFRLDDTAPVSVGDGVLVIHDREESRLAGDLLTLRGEQVSSFS